MAIGVRGIKNMVVKGGRITFCITAPLIVLELYLKDQHTLSAMVGNLSAEFMKIGISSLMGGVAGMGIGGLTTVVWGPIAATISISLLVGEGLNLLDKQYGLTEKLIAALENMGDDIGNMAGQTESRLYRGTKGFFNAQGLHIPNY